MPIDPERLLRRPFPQVVQRYGPRDCILYALGLGVGADPTDPAQLAFVYEDGLRVLPTMASILAYPGLWIREPDTGIDWEQAFHAEQGVDFLRPLPVAGEIVAQTRITGVVDKGADRGALIYSARTGLDRASGEPLFEVRHTTFARRDGGCGDAGVPGPRTVRLPERAPDHVVSWPTLPQQALLYRLNGDPNPHNADPRAARAAGLERPILHGLCTFGMAGLALLLTCCGGAPERLAAMDVRLSAPVYPGETLVIEIWGLADDDALAFRCSVAERDITVLDNGLARLRPA